MAARSIDLTGQRFTNLVVLRRDAPSPKGGSAIWVCQCDCGNQKSISAASLRRGLTRSCGCLIRANGVKGRAVLQVETEKRNQQWEGQVFGRLTVLSVYGRTALCRCDCGTVKEVDKFNLKKGMTASCGCLSRELASKRREKLVKYGDSSYQSDKHPLYKIWRNMKARCTNPTHHAYSNYGGRGITVCPQWLDSFETFAKDMGVRPEGTSLDRINNNEGYSPENCKWASRAHQAKNTMASITRKDMLILRDLVIDKPKAVAYINKLIGQVPD